MEDKVTTIEEYLAQFAGAPLEWLQRFVGFMRENYPNIPGVISYQIPTYKYAPRQYVAFSAAQNHFTLHCMAFERIPELAPLLPPRTRFGKGSIKVPYADTQAIPVLFDFCRSLLPQD